MILVSLSSIFENSDFEQIFQKDYGILKVVDSGFVNGITQLLNMFFVEKIKILTFLILVLNNFSFVAAAMSG